MIAHIEIGSEYWDIPCSDRENGLFPSNTAWFISGRDALRVVIEDICARQSFRTAALPAWCCHAMIQPFLDAGIAVSFYPVYPGSGGGLIQDLDACPASDAVLLMDYFGYSRLSSLPRDRGVVIWDATHSMFSGVPEGADYVFGSLRKWAGFWTGGFAWGHNDRHLTMPELSPAGRRYLSLRKQAMLEKPAYLNGTLAQKLHLETFAQAEEMLEDGLSGPGDPQDIRAARHLDEKAIREKRRENAGVLLESLAGMALFPRLEAADCPLFVPLLAPAGKRDALRRFLIEREIYCPVHWPESSLHQLPEQSWRLYEEALSLICDQRYGPEDMARICRAVEDFFKGKGGGAC